MPLYKATKTIAVFKFTPLKTSISKPLYIEGKISQQLDKSKFGLLCKATRIVTAFSFTRLKTMLPVSLY